MGIAEIHATKPATEFHPADVPHAPWRVSRRLTLPACCLGILLLVGIPLFIRLPLTNDTELFDLQARLVREGSVLYRDALEPNLPGIVWIHLFVRWIARESSEAMRCFDLLVMTGIVSLSSLWLSRLGRSAAHVLWTATAMMLCYLSLSEWCHCQRDMWMLLPTIAGLMLRWRAIRRLQGPSSDLVPLICWGVLEGIVWGVGVWIKPYVVLPAILAWVTSLAAACQLRRSAWDTLGLIAGGLAIGAAGITWMMHNGSWLYFLETARDWNPGYFAAGRTHWTKLRLIGTIARLSPWFFLHFLSVPIAVRMLLTAGRDTEHAAAIQRQIGLCLLSAAYLGWMGQSLFLQHLFDYVHAPGLLLAIIVLSAAWPEQRSRTSVLTAALFGFSVIAIAGSPLLRLPRLGYWMACLTAPAGSSQLQDALAQLDNPNHRNLERIADFLRRQNVGSRDVCCYNSDLVSLYRLLGTRPPTRYVYLFEICVFFPDKRSQMERELAVSGQRYVVTDLVSCGMPAKRAREIGPAGPTAPPPAFKASRDGHYPFSHPVIYRAGTYLVHQIHGAPGQFSVSRTEQAIQPSAPLVAHDHELTP